jgi:hypothetical protein
MNKILFLVSIVFVLNTNIQASKLAECTASFYIWSEMLKGIGEYEESEKYRKAVKIFGDLLKEKYGSESDSLLLKEINYSTPNSQDNIL